MSGSASREALANLRREQESARGSDTSPGALAGLADQLYSVATLLAAQPRLRRMLGDPATPAPARAGLATTLFEGKVSPAALAVTRAAVSERWSSPWDLADSLERSADDTLFASAEEQGVLDEVEDQLFRFERILDAQGELATLLDEATVEPERRVALVDALLAAKVHPITLSLLQHAVASRRRRSVTFVIDELLAEAAARQQRSLARVLSAIELTDEQRARLTSVLTEMYGRPMSIRTAIDPALRGGLVIRVGDEVIDGSIAARIAGARTALAG